MAMSKRVAFGEALCPACAGTGLAKVKQAIKPGRRVYPPKCVKCDGKGRVTKLRAGAARLASPAASRV
jgi:DnaJ-class molecular chaperone